MGAAGWQTSTPSLPSRCPTVAPHEPPVTEDPAFPTSSRPGEQPVVASTTPRIARVDGAAIALTVLFVAWILAGGAPASAAPFIDLTLFALLGIGAGALMIAAGHRAAVARDRWAWYLLGVACGLRMASGALWRWMTGHGLPAPVFAQDITLLRCTMEVVGLVLFVSAKRRRADALRHWLDAATVVIGVGVVEWYFALAPALDITPGAAKGLADVAVLLTGALCALLSALLYLRRADAGVRRAAVLLLFAFSIQAAIDSWQWHGVRYVAGASATLAWWAVWALKLAAARVAVTAPPLRSTGPAAEAPYASGIVPYLFLGAATLSLWLEMAYPRGGTNIWLVVATSTLTALLVARQMVEQQEHAQLARAIAKDQAHFAALVQHSYDAVILTGGDGGASYISPTTRRQLGDNPAFAAPWGLMTAVHPDDAPALQEVLSQAGDASGALVCRVRAADGDWHVYALRVVDLRQDARVGAIVIHGHDITREAMLARRLHEAEEVEALGVFASGLAHDLNNVLSAISGHVEMLLEGVPTGSAAAEDLSAMQRAMSRGLRLTRALLALSRRKAPKLEVVAVGEFLASRAFGGIVPDSACASVRVRIDRVAVGHALDAVLLNAAPGAGAPGPWRVTVTCRDFHSGDDAASELDTGTYAVISCASIGSAGGGPVDEPRHAVPLGPRAPADPATEEGLDVLLARAVLREMGGALALHDDADGTRHVTLHLRAERS